MLYNWSGKPYRSKQVEVAVVVVESVGEVDISQDADFKMIYAWTWTGTDARCLWEREGFESQGDMDAWFRRLVKPGKVLRRKLMRFKMVEERGVA